MKKFLFLILVLTFFSCQTGNSPIKEIKDGKVISDSGSSLSIKGFDDPNSTIFFLVRHAEKTSSMDDPELSPEGEARAKRLAKIMAGVPLNLVTSTNLKRTTQTANPIVFDQKCSISVYRPDNMSTHFEGILKDRKGQKIMVVGHSNTIPALLNLFSSGPVYKDIPEDEYGHFYIASVKGMGQAKIVELEY